MKIKFLNKKILFIVALFLFFLLTNCKPTFAAQFYELVDEILVTDTTLYNYDYIQACLDAGQSPIDAVKKIVDEYHSKYPDTILCSSDDLPKNAFVVRCVHYGDTEDEKMFYVIFNNGKAVKDDVGPMLTQCHMYLFSEIYEDGSRSETCDFYYLKFTKGGFSFGSEDVYSDTSGSVSFQLPIVANNAGYAELVASNYDISSRDTGEVVFQLPTLREATTLVPVIQREKTVGTLQVTLKEIILILPLIIVVVVSFLGLRKALKILFRLLNRA